ncbi:hypothetical protein SISNIDRAFT_24502 [Sistotremastrum niveocremeum HHB9708]|uniref:HRDC domain-containing protein n=2 Tax=Sistotremastraceae TaxID=3402574 RepID=A0A165AN25_9AGAM|nr:hypothetical protein SISNIDRAFT_24502 [Sistotremastrum niveocremeum HHB9708]KZT36983.1 hypothetical protein SISSUDRAFT_908985 [Sistotremastrum suecicum HHB10207 ss-3]
MTTKINAEKASKTKATRRKSQTVVAVAAVASTSKRGLDYYEDLEESTFEENTFDMEAETWDDADPIGDYDDFPDVRVAPDPPVLNSNKEPEDYEAILAAVSELESETDPAQRCYRSLKALREKIAKECHIESLEDILDDPTLELMSVTVPTDMHSMKALLQDCIGNDEEVEKKYQDFGRRFLSTCVTHKMEESSERVPS